MFPSTHATKSASTAAPKKCCELRPGQMFDRFLVGREIGRGGHGVVYRAVDTLIGREVALKTSLRQAGYRHDQQRSRHEARLLSRVADPHVVALYDLIERPEFAVLVMELVDGPSLARPSTAAPLSAAELASIGRQLTDGVEALHRAGVVHGDIKPSNLRFSASGVLKILDLGIGRDIDSHNGCNHKRNSQVISGTVPYMSPEQLLGMPIDTRSDIWSVATVLFELATGCRAFDSGADLIGNDDLCPRVRWLRPDLPPMFDAAIARGMHPLRERRFQTASDLRLALASTLSSSNEKRSVEERKRDLLSELLPRALGTRRTTRRSRTSPRPPVARDVAAISAGIGQLMPLSADHA